MTPKKTILELTKRIERILALFPWLFNLYRLYYRRTVEQEIKLGCISCRDRVLCIGGGPFPCTALEIAGRTGARVKVIDNDPEAVEHARRVVEKLNMDSIVQVEHAEGKKLDVREYSVIHVALQIHPRDEVLKNVLQRASRGVRVLLRAPGDGFKSYYSPLSEDYFSRSCGYIKQGSKTMKATLLFVNGGERNRYEQVRLKKMGIDACGNAAGRRTSVAG